MKQKPRSLQKRKLPKTHLRLPELEYSKTAVLNSLISINGQCGYGHAIDEVVDWYCSEPRLALNRTVVLRYRTYLEARREQIVSESFQNSRTNLPLPKAKRVSREKP
jgi:hypothetical protein